VEEIYCQLEQDISPDAYRRFQACTAALEPNALQAAYRACWLWGTEMMSRLGRGGGGTS
jgi:Lincosamide nucleotidyltransferase-like, C-terminal domain